MNNHSINRTHRKSTELASVMLTTSFIWGVLATSLSLSPFAEGQDQGKETKKSRTIYVPFEQLDILFDGTSQHVYLSREEYQQLLRESRKTEKPKSPRSHVLASANHQISLAGEIAEITTKLKIETLNDGLHAIAIPFQSLYLQSAEDAAGAKVPLGKNANGQTIAFLNGRKTHELVLKFVNIVKLETARQSLQFRLVPASTNELELSVKGNVELASGAAVLNRSYNQADNTTNFQLVGGRKPMELVLSVNNKKLQANKSILAKSVFIHELTSTYEQIHARVNVDILYGETNEVRFELPKDFQITEVTCPDLSSWSVVEEGGITILSVLLRDSLRQSFALNIAATSTKVDPENWQLKQMKPIGFTGAISVIGLVAEERFELQSLTHKGLIAIDNDRIQASIPETVFKTTTGAPAIATMAAFYAPDADFSLEASLTRPPAQLQVVPTSILFLSDQRQKFIGQYQVKALNEKTVNFDLSVPADWRVSSIKGSDGKAIPFQRNQDEKQKQLNVRIPGGLPAGGTFSFVFEAESATAEWTKDWQSTDIVYPRFQVEETKLEKGAIAVAVEDDLVVRPKATKSLETLLKDQKSLFGLAGFNTSLTFEIIELDYDLSLVVNRLQPQLTATAYNFFRLLNQQLMIHQELAFDVRSARTKTLSFRLPESTPDEIRIEGLDGVRIAQSDSSVENKERVWKLELAEPTLGELRVAIQYSQSLSDEAPKDFKLPLIRAENVSYQTTLVAFEGNPDFDVELDTSMRSIDVGEMGDAQYVPGPRLLGAYSAADSNPEISIDVSRRNIHQLPTTIIESVAIQSLVANNGHSQSIAQYRLLTKVPFVELKLPETAKLWAVQLDGIPTRPQVRGDSVLISLPPNTNLTSRSLVVLYADEISKIALSGKVKLNAPRLRQTLEDGKSVDVPQAQLKWQITLPSGYTITDNDGTVFTTTEERRPLPLQQAGQSLLNVLSAPFMNQFRAAKSFAKEAKKSDTADYMMEMGAAQHSGDDPFGYEADMDMALNELSKTDKRLPKPKRSETRTTRETEAASGEMAFGSDEKPDEKFKREQKKPASQASRPDSTIVDFEEESILSKDILKNWLNKGVAGLTVSEMQLNMDEQLRTIELESLGAEARLSVSIVDQDRMNWLSYAYAGVVLAIGLFLCRFSWKLKVYYLMMVVMIVGVVPMFGDWTEIFWGGLESSLYVCCLLVPIYIAYAICSWLLGFLVKDLPRFLRWLFGLSEPGIPAGVGLLLVLSVASSANASPLVIFQESKDQTAKETGKPVSIPSDAIIIPYNPEEPEIESDQIFVPYQRYLELLKSAEKTEPDPATNKMAAKFGWTSAQYQASLEGNDLKLFGKLELEVFTDEAISIPLPLEGAVLTRAILDGQPAQLEVISQPTVPTKTQKGKGPSTPKPQLVLLNQGKGRKSFEVDLRIRIDQTGGRKRVQARIPTTQASQLVLTSSSAGTEVNYRIQNRSIRYVASKAADEVRFPIAADGKIDFNWKENIANNRVDQNLSLNSTALFDVRNDGLHLVWQLDFQFRSSKRDQFEVELPKDFSVVRIYGQNVRAWEVREETQANILTVTLLSEAENREQFTLELANRKIDLTTPTSFPMPTVVIPDAAIHSGQITVRKSDSLDLQTDTMIGISRIDVSEAKQVKPKSEPLFHPTLFQAFEFSRTPYSVAIRCRPKRKGIEVKTRSLIDIREKSCGIDARVNCSSVRPVHELTLELPIGLNIQKLDVPTSFRQSISKGDKTQTLKLFLGSGLQGEFGINIAGRLEDHDSSGEIELPRILVNESVEQSGEIAAIAEPQLIVEPDELNGCESVLLSSVTSWLNQRNRSRTRVAIIHKDASYSGKLKISRKKPVVNAISVSNVNVTLRSIEESIIVSFDIRDAGVDRLSFLIPASLKDARIKSDLVREKVIEPVGEAEDAKQYRVTLQLQDYVIGQYRILLEKDRGLSDQKLEAPIPSFGENLDGSERFVTIQNSGFDELLVKDSEGLEKLDRRQKPFRRLKELIGGADIRQGYLVTAKEGQPVLTYQTNPRQLVQTVGASIGLSEIEISVDRSGGYRAEQKLFLDNRTEPFLEIEMPEKSRLWTVQVAGESVKPIAVKGKDNVIRIPLIKTADGDSDFGVELKYGGSLGRLTNLSRLKIPFTKTRNISVASSNVKLNLPDDFEFWWFDGSMGVSEETQIEQARSAYESKLFSKLQSQVNNSKSELVRQRAAQNLSLMDAREDAESNAQQEIQLDEELQIDNRDRFNSVLESQRLQLFGNSGNVSNSYGGNFKAESTKKSGGAKGKTRGLNDMWFDSNGLVNPKVLEQNKRNNRFNAPSFNTQQAPQQQRGAGAGGGFGGMAQTDSSIQLRGQQKAQEAFQKQVADNLNVLQQQSQNARRGGNKKDAILRKYRDQLSNRGGQINAAPNMPGNDTPPIIAAGGVILPSQEESEEDFAQGVDNAEYVQGPALIRAGSLNLQFQHRGQSYLFQTTSEDLNLQVTVVSKSLKRRSIHFAILLGVVGVMSCTIWFFGTRNRRRRESVVS